MEKPGLKKDEIEKQDKADKAVGEEIQMLEPDPEFPVNDLSGPKPTRGETSREENFSQP